MVRLQAFLALLEGFAVMLALGLVATAILRRWAPQWVGRERHLRPGYVLVNLGYSFLAAAAGGYVTAWAGGVNALRVILGLAIAVLVLGAISALQARGPRGQVFVPGVEAQGRQPVWYQTMLVVISPLGVVAGGLVRLKAVGIL
jgi:hypothetical protein